METRSVSEDQQARSQIAVSMEEASKFGCPYCGYRSSLPQIANRGCAVLVCGECHRSFVALVGGVTRSHIGFGAGENTFYPELQPHPRRGIPAHGRPDKQPEGGGEFFSPRGIGLDTTPGCFVCGGESGMHHNIVAFVQCKAAGERVVALFEGKGTWLDYREETPDRVQVKVGACNEHQLNLQGLYVLTQGLGGVITPEVIESARQ